jgi:hypothetical protein
MNTFLFIITLLSASLAAVLLAINWRLLLAERQRSAARVQALAEAAAEPSTMVTASPMVASTPIGDRPAEPDAPSAHPAPVVVSQELFHTSAAPPPSFRRMALPASLGVAIVGTILSLSGLAVWGHDRPKGTAAVGDAVPLELVALRHERTADGLSITGLVHNPSGGHLIADLDVLVFLFDRNSALLSSVRAPLDFRTLAPGDESPFEVSVGRIGAIGRYRVSFSADNKVVPHVDRRQNPVVAVARSQ